MTKVPYIEYRKMKGFYTIEEVCDLFQMDKNQLRQKSEFYSILPRQNEIGEWGFVTYAQRSSLQCQYLRHSSQIKLECTGGCSQRWNLCVC